MMKLCGFIACVMLAAGLTAAPQIEFDSQAGVAFPALQIPVGVRATGMGNVYTSLGEDVYALNWNPAGLSGLESYQLGLAHNEWASSLGIKQELGFYGQNLGPKSGAALSLNYVNLGSIEKRDTSGALLGRFDSSFLALTLGYGQSILSEAFRVGLEMEYLSQTLYGADQSGFCGGLGILYGFSDRTRAGLSLLHLGSGLQGFSPPSTFQAGLSSQFMDDALSFGFDAELPFNGSPQLKTGGEYSFGALALRAGWRQALGGADSALQSGLSAGAGFKAGMLRLDYSYAPYGDLSSSHRVQATLELPGNFFAARNLGGADSSSTTAESFYNGAQVLEKDGETLKALVQYQRAVEAYPSALKSKPQFFYTASLKKVEDLQRQLSKGSGQGQIQKLSKESLATAEKAIAAGHFKDAIATLKQAALIDPGNPAISAMMKEARKGLEEKINTYRNAAQFGVNGHDLNMAVENYRKLLAIDASDGEATGYLSRHRKEIKEQLNMLDRKAIFFYVGGKLEEALKVWTEAEALDYFGDVDFKRNIDKARKQLEVRDK